jgi:hypothetical protein
LPDRYHRELERRLRVLTPAAREALPSDTLGWFLEFLDHGEYGLAVEVAAEALVLQTAPDRALARGLLDEADLMGLSAELRRGLQVAAE